ncbi:MAG: DUF1254 domain-containing protein [Algicola sp.]|nr:DUF1254 domain-containing protein [Algicola sp.]
MKKIKKSKIPTVIDEPTFIGSGTLETKLGPLEFEGGFPTEQTAIDLFEWRRYFRAIEAFQQNIPAMSMYSARKGQADFEYNDGQGTIISASKPNVVLRFETLMDSRALFLTANTDTVYAYTFLDLKAWGPTVVEAPADMLGTFNDMWMRFIEDVGGPGPDKGKGGKFLIYPPDYDPIGLPDEKNYYTAKSRTYGVWLILRSKIKSMSTEDIAAASAKFDSLKLYPYSEADQEIQRETHLVDISKHAITTIHSDDIDFFSDLNTLIKEEAPNAISDLERFTLASIGIRSDGDFDPMDDQVFFEDVCEAAGAMARANSYASQDKDKYIYNLEEPAVNPQWLKAFIGGDENFAPDGYVDIDKRAYFSYIATVCTPAMCVPMVGEGSQYLLGLKDASQTYLVAKENYTLKVPLPVPCEDFWSLVIYDASSRSMLRRDAFYTELTLTDAPSINSYSLALTPIHTHCHIHFGPTNPQLENTLTIKHCWIDTAPYDQTDIDKGIFVLFRLYGPTAEYFEFGVDGDDDGNDSWILPDIVKQPQ